MLIERFGRSLPTQGAAGSGVQGVGECFDLLCRHLDGSVGSAESSLLAVDAARADPLRSAARPDCPTGPAP
jgi:hypothetical protein